MAASTREHRCVLRLSERHCRDIDLTSETCSEIEERSGSVLLLTEGCGAILTQIHCDELDQRRNCRSRSFFGPPVVAKSVHARSEKKELWPPRSRRDAAIAYRCVAEAPRRGGADHRLTVQQGGIDSQGCHATRRFAAQVLEGRPIAAWVTTQGPCEPRWHRWPASYGPGARGATRRAEWQCR